MEKPLQRNVSANWFLLSSPTSLLFTVIGQGDMIFFFLKKSLNSLSCLNETLLSVIPSKFCEFFRTATQLAFICSKLTMETP